ncbi:MAG: hypothetical protein K8S16_12350 [Bacteroidales bacterium]|nr:hypothetical protein [Bacteroidales bacterium]
MPKSPKEIYNKIESVKGKKLAFYLIPLFILFLLVGIAVGNLMPKMLKKDEALVTNPVNESIEKESVQYKGKVVYLDPHFYPNDEINFYLEDDNGKQVILLKTNDQKLDVVEGLSVIVFGEVEKTMNGEEDVLDVEKIVVKN